MAGRPRTRAKRQAQEQARKNGKPILTATRIDPKHEYLADIYAERYTTFQALRMAMVQNGIVDHGINPYEVIQRAIDDTTTDYLLLRREIERDSNGDPDELVDHPLYPYMESMREAMVRYATFATQYDIQKRQLKLSETRVALLSTTLRDVLLTLGLTHDQVKEVPRLLINRIKEQEPSGPNGFTAHKLDPVKAEAIAEILHHDSEVTIIEDAEVVNPDG
jgi:hypothetical protein